MLLGEARAGYSEGGAVRGYSEGSLVEAGAKGVAELTKLAEKYLPKKTAAMATYEHTPYVKSGHLTGLVEAPFAERLAHAQEPAASWMLPSGEDSIMQALGQRQWPTRAATGTYTPEATGIMENNPAFVAPASAEVGPDWKLAPDDRRRLDIGQAARAFGDVQGAGAWHAPIAGAPMDISGSLHIPANRTTSIETLRRLAELTGAHGLPDVVDNGMGVSAGSFMNPPPSGEATRDNLLHGLRSKVQQIMGRYPEQRSLDSNYLSMFESSPESEQGKGNATRELQKIFEGYGNAGQQDMSALDSESHIRDALIGKIWRDNEMAAATGRPVRLDAQKAQSIWASSGLRGLFDAAQKAGYVGFPAIAGAVGAQALQQAPPGEDAPTQ